MSDIQKKFNGKDRSLDARPDRYDIRDRKYQPKLVNLPDVYPSPKTVGELLETYNSLILDQGNEGACTGFGLAAMINYLRFKEKFMPGPLSPGPKKKKPQLPSLVSPRMLYENARLYDEWPGENYSGSSARGAMRGWHRHGVCLETTWPYLQGAKPGKPAKGWEKEAAGITLGAYYRVEIEDISDLQSAIYEVGAVYASATVHNGWAVQEKAKDLPVINWTPVSPATGGHAFALVGFNSEGFIVQNSWGPAWGFHGFALITYNDWLANATDAWVAALGVPRTTVPVPRNFSTESFNLVAGATVTANAAARINPTAKWSEDEARNHTLVLGNEGVLLRASAAQDPAEFVNDGLMGDIRAWMKDGINRRVVVYSHGGLNSEAAAIKRVQVMGPYFKANNVFPIFVVWKTGWKESLVDMGEDILRKLMPGGKDSAPSGSLLGFLGEKLTDGWDYTVENALGFLGKSLWRQMKQNAAAAGSPLHGGSLLAAALTKLRKDVPGTQIHLIGHSAGSIWLGELLTLLRALPGTAGIVSSCSLYAAACTVDFANQHYVPAVTGGLLPGSTLWCDNMSDAAERADNVAGFYRRSLLYFVSRACEEARKMPILGMEAAWNPKFEKPENDDVFNQDLLGDVFTWRAFADGHGVPKPRFEPADYTVEPSTSSSVHNAPPSHGGFDNDIRVLTRTVERIIGGPLQHPITTLEGF